MHGMEQLLPDSLFCRIHKSYIVPLNKIDQLVTGNVQLVKEKKLPLGSVYKSEALKKIKAGLEEGVFI
jgi:DNA-binding LytR/AlgR family response regulator